MAITNNDALREVHSAKINEIIRAETQLDSPTFVNYDYEADARDANSVRLITYADQGVQNWDPTANATITFSSVSARKVNIPLDQFPYVQYRIEGAHQLQTNTKAGQAMIRNAANALRIEREKFIAKKMATDLASVALLKDPSTISSTTYPDIFRPSTANVDEGFALQDTTATTGGRALFMKAVMQAAIRMDKYGIPREGRYMLVPPYFREIAVKEFALSTEGQERRIAQGWLTNLYDFDVYMSHYLYEDVSLDADLVTGESTWVICGHPSLFTFVDQLGGVQVQIHEMQHAVRNMAYVASAQYGGGYKKNAVEGSTTGRAGACLIQVDLENDTQITN